MSRPLGTTSASASAGTARAREHGDRLPALVLAALLLVGAGLGSLNLLVDGVLREGAARQVYAAMLGLLLLVALWLVVRRRAGTWTTSGLVLLGDLAYVVVSLTIEDPVRHASPLMLLPPAVVAAWFLGPRVLAVHMAVVPVACGVALWPGSGSTAAVLVQVAVSAGVLDGASLGVFLLRRRMERLLRATEAASWIDPLTGLHNRRYLADEIGRVWRQARRDGTRVVAMVLDLDNFKQVNDAHGHCAGDALLQAVAASLAATVRPADLLARTGGEELVVIGMVSDSDEATRLGERLRAAVARTRTEAGHGVTASVGLALVRPVDGDDPAASLWRLIDRADAAMYEAKRAGRDRVAAVLTVPPPRPVRREEDVPAAEPGA